MKPMRRIQKSVVMLLAVSLVQLTSIPAPAQGIETAAALQSKIRLTAGVAPPAYTSHGAPGALAGSAPMDRFSLGVESGKWTAPALTPAANGPMVAAPFGNADRRPAAGPAARLDGGSFSGVLAREVALARAIAAPPAGASPAVIVGSVGQSQAVQPAAVAAPRTSRGQKIVAWIVLTAVAATAITFAVRSARDDDPKLTPGTAVKVAP